VELTKRHKLLLGVVGAGGLAVLGDQLFLQGGLNLGPASAKAEQAKGPPVDDDEGIVMTQAKARVVHGSIADDLQTYSRDQGWDSEVLADTRLNAFAAPSAWLGGEKSRVEVREEQRPRRAADTSAVRLTSVWVEQKAAFISGVRMSVGETREVILPGGGVPIELTLLAIEGPSENGDVRGAAVVEFDGKRVRLEIRAAALKSDNAAPIPLRQR
jgi:hypothetical protein